MPLAPILFLMLAILPGLAHGRPDAPLIAAASDLQFALDEIAETFTEDSGQRVRVVYGSSGNFHRQIMEGAPFQLFLSADEDYVLKLHRAGRTEDEGTLYALGRIVLMAPHSSSLAVDENLDDLRAALIDGRLRRFAIANPVHAPYGQRAQEALQHADLWQVLQGRLVYGENVSQAAQFATSGNAQGGIIAYSLALAPSVASRGQYALIPASWHRPLLQRMALVTGASDEARAFYSYLQQPAARAVLERYGFELPDRHPFFPDRHPGD